jgi:hypothetical protein
VGGVVVGGDVAGGVEELDAAGECTADGGGVQLGQGRQGGVPADAVPATGLGPVPVEGVLAGGERVFDRPAAPGDGNEIGHGGGPARRRPAQGEGMLWRHACGRLPRAHDQPTQPADGAR